MESGEVDVRGGRFRVPYRYWAATLQLAGIGPSSGDPRTLSGREVPQWLR